MMVYFNMVPFILSAPLGLLSLFRDIYLDMKVTDEVIFWPTQAILVEKIRHFKCFPFSC